MKLVRKEDFKPKIKSMFQKLQNEVYQLENNQAKGFKLGVNIM